MSKMSYEEQELHCRTLRKGRITQEEYRQLRDIGWTEEEINASGVTVIDSPHSKDLGDHIARRPPHPRYVNDVPAGYDDMAAVLVRALEQSACGKGKERHAQDKPFSEQPMQQLIALYGTGFACGQAGKKMQEALRLPHDAAIRELLGAIVYAAGAIIYMENHHVG